MVKGLSRRVIVLDSPDPTYFEQAIFIVRNDAAGEGVSAHELVSQARRVAGDCTDGKPVSKRKYLPFLTALLGGGAVGLLWLLTVLL